MTLEAIKATQAKSPETQTVFQLVIPGMEEFMAKLNQKSKTTGNSQSK